MAILLYAALFGLAFVVQGVYILKTGDLRWFLVRPLTRSRPRKPATLLARIMWSLFYLSCGAGILTLLVHNFWLHLVAVIGRTHRHRPDTGFLLVCVALLAVGVSCLARPATMARLVKQGDADLSNYSPNARYTIRIVGAGLSLMGLYGIFLSLYAVG